MGELGEMVSVGSSGWMGSFLVTDEFKIGVNLPAGRFDRLQNLFSVSLRLRAQPAICQRQQLSLQNPKLTLIEYRVPIRVDKRQAAATFFIRVGEQLRRQIVRVIHAAKEGAMFVYPAKVDAHDYSPNVVYATGSGSIKWGFD